MDSPFLAGPELYPQQAFLFLPPLGWLGLLTLPRPGVTSVAFVPSLGSLGWNLCPTCSRAFALSLLPHDSLRRRGLAQTGSAVSRLPGFCAALPVKQEEADHFPLAPGWPSIHPAASTPHPR